MINALKKSLLGRKLIEKLIWYKIASRAKYRLTSEEFKALKARFGADHQAMAKYCHDAFLCRVIIDPQCTRIIKKLKADFNLTNFIETGTYVGETSTSMSLIFERVMTCDVKDWPRQIEFYSADNLTFELNSSPDFLRGHLNEIKKGSFFFLDAHWGPYWPLHEELKIIFDNCENPVISIDDFDSGNGLYYDAYAETKLNLDYIVDHVPADYKFMLNPSSNRNRGLIFIVPPSAPYGCAFKDRANYSHEKHSLWGKLPA
ncbi:MAG: hypothetical protein RLZZ350_1731 [Verrucomicrobiota bacterium]|jgi:hypothetical protein